MAESMVPAPAPTSAGWVIDASVTMPWFFADEATPFTEGLLDSLGTQELWAPTLWVLECTNVLQSAQRRRRIEAARRAEVALDRVGCAVDRRLATEEIGLVGARRVRVAAVVAGAAQLIAAARALGHPVLSAPHGISN